MSTESRSPARCYQLPEDAHLELQQIRDRLRLLACLAAPRSPHDDLPGAELPIAPAALAHCYQELADRLERSLREVYWPESESSPSR